MRLSAAILCGAMLATMARGDILPSAGGLSAPGVGAKGESHAWIALPSADPEGGAAIVHLPPRRAADRSDTIADVEDGSVRLALRLPKMPERLAAWDNRLWIAFPAESAVGGKRRVLTMSVERGPLGGSWVSEEAEGRLPSLPFLPGDQELVGFVGSARGPIALMYAAGRLEYTLLVQAGSEWKQAALPDDLAPGPDAEPGSRLHLVCAANGFGVVSPGAWWQAGFVGRSAASDGERTGGELNWSRTALSLRTESGLPVPMPGSAIVWSGGHLVYAARAPDGSAELWSPGSQSCRLLATVKGVGVDGALVPLDQIGRVALIWAQPESSGTVPAVARSKRPATTTRIVEVSSLTGAVLYDGPARVGGPVSSAELKLLAMVLVGVMVVVLLFVLRPEEGGKELCLPRGLALAEPGRRIAAGAIDLLVALIGAAAIKHVPLQQLLVPSVLLYDPAGVETIVLVLGLGVAHATLGEWLLGRSIGKLLTRCSVVRVGVPLSGDVAPIARGPGLFRALVRNVVRWVLAPLAITGLNAPDHRHRGDLAAGTVVVIRIADVPE